jgi:hypothetical protein
VSRRVGIAVGRDDLDPESLQGDDDFLAEFARAEQQYPRGAGRQRRPESDRAPACR